MENNSFVDLLKKRFETKIFLTPDDLSGVLECERDVIINWTRKEEKYRPPRIIVGRDIRFPKAEFLDWLMKTQFRSSNGNKNKYL